MAISTQRAELGLASRWGWIVCRGVVAILFGLFALARPGPVGLAFVLMFAAYAFISGIVELISAARGGRAGDPRWGTFLVEGLLYIVAGIVAVLWPASTVMAFVWVLGFWAIITGALQIGSAVRLHAWLANEWALGVAGVVSVLFGVLMLARPMVGGLAIVWWLAAYALVFGVLQVVLGFRLRRFAHAHQPRADLPRPLRQST